MNVVLSLLSIDLPCVMHELRPTDIFYQHICRIFDHFTLLRGYLDLAKKTHLLCQLEHAKKRHKTNTAKNQH